MRTSLLQHHPHHRAAYPWQVFWLLFFLLSAGCAPFARGAEEPEVQPGSVLLEDDFSDPNSGWGVWTREDASVDYDKGGLRFIIHQPRYDFWSVAGKDYRNVQIEVDTVKWSGPDDNDFGVICRYVDKNNFYMLVISSDGYYGIARMREGQYSMIGAEQLQYSDAILQGTAINHLRADCNGEMLRLYANDQLLMEARDNALSSGDVGLVAGAYGEGGVEVYFDNFLVMQAGE